MYDSASGTRQMSAVSGNAVSAALGFEDANGGCRILGEFPGRPPRPPQQLAIAIRTFSLERVVGAGLAEGALVGADVGFGAVAGKIAVATLAVGSQLQHDQEHPST